MSALSFRLKLRMRNIKLTLLYDGEHFEGWQRQKTGRTVQGVLEQCVLRLTGVPTDVHGSGRTDAGVHALGQVASFKTSSSLPPEIVRRALNATLPADVRVLEAVEVDSEFHARFSATGKRYCYHILLLGSASPFLSRYVWSIPGPLGLDAMREAASLMVGEHDYQAFMASGSAVKSSVRTISELRITQSPKVELLGMALQGELITISVQANGFLRHMVRNIAGTLVEVGRGAYGASEVAAIIASLDRGRAGITAPASGLFLERVFY